MRARSLSGRTSRLQTRLAGLGCLAVVLGLVFPTPASAQVVAQLDVQPAALQLTVGETAELLASAFDAQGRLLQGVDYRWVSTNLTVVTVEADPTIPSLAIVRALAAGVAAIELRVGNQLKTVRVGVAAAPGVPVAPERRPVVEPPPDTVLPSGVENRTRMLTARVRGHPFGVAPNCGSGFFVSGQGLLLTTYRTIRGGTRLEVEHGGRSLTDVQVAAYDVQSDLAVLRVRDVQPGDSLPVAEPAQIGDDQVVWSFGYPNCGDLDARRLRITAWQNRPAGPLTLSSALGATEQGAALVTQRGAVAGSARGDATATAAPQLGDLLSQARLNYRTRQLLSGEEVARRQQHLYGSLAISTGVAGTIARVQPLEPWQWQELAAQSLTPFTFSGPVGRYRVEVLQEGQVRQTTEAVVQPGIIVPLAVTLPTPVVAAPAVAPAPRRGGGFPWAVVVLLLGGGGAAACFVAGPCKAAEEGTPPPPPPPSGPGSIVITVPNP